MIFEYRKPYRTIKEWQVYKRETGIDNILFEEKFSIRCDFKIEKKFKRDIKGGIFGKAGQNFGLNFDKEIDSLVFEFRTNTESPEFHCVIFDQINSEVVSKGVNMTITKDKNTFKFYLKNKIIKVYRFKNDFIDEYWDTPFFFGALNPGATDRNDRCYCQVRINLFTIIKNEVDIKILNDIRPEDPNTMCYYDFMDYNIRRDIYDKSNNFNFIELVPKEFIK